MKKIIFPLKVAAVFIFVATMAILYILFPNKLIENYYFLFSALIFSFSLACVAYIPSATIESDSMDGWLASIGVQGFFLLFLISISAKALNFSFLGMYRLGLALNVIAITVFLVMLLVVSFMFKHIGLISKKHNFNSSQTLWAQQLEAISLECNDPLLRADIEKKAFESRYLARDFGPESSEINSRIDSMVESLGDFVAKSDVESARTSINKYSELIVQRELFLRMKRTKA